VNLIVSHGVLNPFFESGDASVDSRLVWTSTSVTPRDNAQNGPLAIDFLHHRTTRVTLTTVLSSNAKFAGADHGIRDLTTVILALLAGSVRDERDGDHLKRRGSIACCVTGSGAAPTGNNDIVSRSVIGIFVGKLWEASGLRVAVVSEILAEFEERNVIVLVAASILRMRKVTLYFDFLFASIRVTKIVLASDNSHSAASIRETMSRRQDPSLPDDGSAAEMAPSLNAHLPREGSSLGVGSSYDVAIRFGMSDEVIAKESVATLAVIDAAAAAAAATIFTTTTAASVAVLFISTVGAIGVAITNIRRRDADPTHSRTRPISF